MDGTALVSRALFGLAVAVSFLALSVASASAATIPANAISARGDVSCSFNAAGTPTCWGDSSNGQTSPPAGLQVIEISAGRTHVCARTYQYTAVCWGNPADGKTAVPADLGPIKEISSGEHHTCAVKMDDTVRCWGRNDKGQLSPPPGALKQLSAGDMHNCAIKVPSNEAACWGDNGESRATPTAGLGGVQKISAGWRHSCAIKLDGTPHCWGSNGWDQSDIPPGVGTLTDISAGGSHSCGVKTDGSGVCWGGGTNFGQTTPPLGLGAVTQIVAGSEHTCAIQVSSGAPVCWGRNNSGQTSVPSISVIPTHPPLKYDPLPPGCFPKGVIIYNLKVKGKKMIVSGFARGNYLGQPVTINYRGKPTEVIGSSSVKPDGSFTVSVPAPAKKIRTKSGTRYRANVPGESSAWFIFNRRMASNEATYSKGKLRVAGQLKPPFAKKMTLKTSVRPSCNSPWATIKSIKVGRTGKFAANVKYADKTNTGVVFVRMYVKVPKSAKNKKLITTYSYIIPVVIK